MAQRQWRISVDGATVCFGSVQTEADASSPPARRFLATSWTSAPALRDPAAALSAEVLSLVFARLGLRERLTCAAVCRTWRRELSPAAGAAAWACVDTSELALPLRHRFALHGLLTQHLLPRYGAHIRELSLRGTAVTDATLHAVVAACPQLLFLDIRDCEAALTRGCQDGDAVPYALMELGLTLYARASPGSRFTLLMEPERRGPLVCTLCTYFCPGLARVVTNALAAMLAWPVKGAAVAGPGWLRCDLAPCPLREAMPPEDVECDRVMPTRLPGYARPEEWVSSYRCDACATVVCYGCTVEHECGDDTRYLCAPCSELLAADCSVCAEDMCARCCTKRCVAPGCRSLVCDVCVEDEGVRCDDCGAVACDAHRRTCAECADAPGCEVNELGFRAVLRCCGCHRTYCFNCDRGPGGQAGDVPRERPPPCYSEVTHGLGCGFCVSWPRFCTARASAVLALRIEAARDAKEEAKTAAAVEACAAAEAAEAAAAAAAAADAAAEAAEEADEAACDAADAADRLAHANALLAEAHAAML